MDKLTAIKIKYEDGHYSEEIPVSALAENVEWDDTHTLVDVLGDVAFDTKGSVQEQLTQLFNDYVKQSEQISSDVSKWLTQHVNPTGTVVTLDTSLSIAGSAADADAINKRAILSRLSSDILDNDLNNFTEPGWASINSNFLNAPQEIPITDTNGLVINYVRGTSYLTQLYFNTCLSSNRKYYGRGFVRGILGWAGDAPRYDNWCEIGDNSLINKAVRTKQALPNGTDLNTIKDNGIYFLHNHNNHYVNLPQQDSEGKEAYILIVLKVANSFVYQILINYYGIGTGYHTYLRSFHTSIQPEPWRKLSDFPEWIQKQNDWDKKWEQLTQRQKWTLTKIDDIKEDSDYDDHVNEAGWGYTVGIAKNCPHSPNNGFFINFVKDQNYLMQVAISTTGDSFGRVFIRGILNHAQKPYGRIDPWHEVGYTAPDKAFVIGNSNIFGSVWKNQKYDHLAPWGASPYSVILKSIGISENNTTTQLRSSTGFVDHQYSQYECFADELCQTDLSSYSVVLTQLYQHDMKTDIGTIEDDENSNTICGKIIKVYKYIKQQNGNCQFILTSVFPISQTIYGNNVFTGRYPNGKNILQLDQIVKKLAQKYHFIYLTFTDCDISYTFHNFVDGSNDHANNDTTYKIMGAHLGGQASSKIHF